MEDKQKYEEEKARFKEFEERMTIKAQKKAAFVESACMTFHKNGLTVREAECWLDEVKKAIQQIQIRPVKVEMRGTGILSSLICHEARDF